MLPSGCKVASWCLLLCACAGCQEQCPPLELDTTGVRPSSSCEDLAVVLKAAVRGNGLIHAEALRKAAPALEAQVKLLAVTGPTATPALFPTPEHALAYWYNARAAWSMKLLLAEQCPRTVRRERLEERLFPLDGRRMSLLEIRETLAADADFRTSVAVPGATTTDARLPAAPFVAEGIRGRIAERFAGFLDDEMRFVIDIRRKRILVPPALWRFRERLIREHNDRHGTEGANLITALLPYVTGSPHRRLQDAIGYQVVELRSAELTAEPENQ